MNSIFYKALNVLNNADLKAFSKLSGVPISRLKYYAEEIICPEHGDLEKILKTTGLSKLEFQLKIGNINSDILQLLASNSSSIAKMYQPIISNEKINQEFKFEPAYSSPLGKLYQADCIPLIKSLPRESVDLIFADPPFNLDKLYESEMDDKLPKEAYLKWTEEWVLACIDLLKEGGSFFTWNLPFWNTYVSQILNKHLNFKNWIAVDIKSSLPIKNRLYPSHYSLLYYTKGDKPTAFNPQRLPLEICRHCSNDTKDYGGYKDKLNPEGINLSDVWYDIPPVRHSKYKTRDSNELSLKLLERIISMGSNKGDTVFDPFGGSGTTYIVSEILERKWIGCEIGPVDSIIQRFEDIEFHKKVITDIQYNKNVLFTEKTRKLRLAKNLWLPETLEKAKKKEKNIVQQIDIFQES